MSENRTERSDTPRTVCIGANTSRRSVPTGAGSAGCGRSLLLAFCLSAALAGTANAQFSEEVLRGIKNLPVIDITNPASLYDTHQVYALPLRIAFQGGNQQARRIIFDRLETVVDGTIPLGKLRAVPAGATARPSARLLDSARSGPATRRILPTRVSWLKAQDPAATPIAIIDEPGIATFQFMHLLSTAARLAARFPPPSVDELMRERVQLAKMVGFLLDDWVLPYWSSVEAWHYAGPFPNIRLRFESRFQPDPNWPKRYYSGVTDEELHFLATAADLRALAMSNVSQMPIEFSPAQRATLDAIHVVAMRLLRMKISDGPGFVFGPGDWWDHGESAWAGCESETLPPVPCPKETVSEDTAHGARWPLWLDSLAAGTGSGTADHHYIERLGVKLAWQIVNRVLDWEGGWPRMRNYLDGTNGWYRVGYHSQNFGYGPYALGGAVYYGSWFLLGQEQFDIRRFSNALCGLMESMRPDDVVFRTKYYGGHENVPNNDRGHGEKDIGGKGSVMAASCHMARALGYF